MKKLLLMALLGAGFCSGIFADQKQDLTRAIMFGDPIALKELLTRVR